MDTWREKIEAAHDMISALCQPRGSEGGREWIMSIPANPATYQHQVASLPRGVAVTLVLTGPQERDWGFWRGKEWVHWREFVGLSNKLRALWCEEGKV